MRKVLFATGLGAMAAFAAGSAGANDQLIRMSQNPAEWAMPTGDYANTRYSKLKQITAANVGKLQVAWTFSTGVLRGHEGGPLIIENMMYVHTPFPNKVYALDLSNENKIVWSYEPKQDPNVIPVMCCDTVNRGLAFADGKIFLHQADDKLVALNAKNGNVEWTAINGDPTKGQTGTSAPMVVKDKVLVGTSGGEFGVQCSMTAYSIKDGKQVWKGYSEGPDDQLLVDDKTTSLGKPIGKDFEPEDLGRRSVEDRRRLHVGLDLLRSVAQPRLLRFGQSFDLESEAASRRQQVVDDDLGAQPGYRRGEVGLSDDAPRRVGL